MICLEPAQQHAALELRTLSIGGEVMSLAPRRAVSQNALFTHGAIHNVLPFPPADAPPSNPSPRPAM
jgi:hypothetical protein